MRVLSFFDFQVNYMLIDGFTSRRKIPVNSWSNQWKWTYILDFGPWNQSALNMGYMDEQPSRMPGSGRARVGVDQGRGTKAMVFSMMPLPVATTRATLVGGAFREPRLFAMARCVSQLQTKSATPPCIINILGCVFYKLWDGLLLVTCY